MVYYSNSNSYSDLDTERVSLKSEPTSVSDNDMHCGFIFRLEHLPRTLTLKLFKRTSNFSTYLGTAVFSIISGSEGVLRGDMVLETDSSTIKIALIFDVIQHLHQVLCISIILFVEDLGVGGLVVVDHGNRFMMCFEKVE